MPGGPGMSESRLERVFTPGMKRRAVVRVLKDALHDAQRESGIDRVVGIFGVVIREDGKASLISALTMDELEVVFKALPEGLNRIAQQLSSGGKKELTH